MRLRRAIRADPVLVNPLTPELAALVAGTYDYWRLGPATFYGRYEPPAPGWVYEPLEWENVQLWICHRPLLEVERSETGRSGRLLAAIIPGTNELADWSAGNLNPLPVRIGGLPGRWRRGFTAGGSWVWSQLEDRLGPEDVLAVAGHSAGGAMAITCAGHALRDGDGGRFTAVLAFAAPRTATRAAAQVLESAFGGGIGQRFILGFDVVPWAVPPLGWRHALEAVYIGSDGRARDRYRFAAELWSALRRRGVQAVGHHGMRNYLSWARSLPAAEPLG